MNGRMPFALGLIVLLLVIPTVHAAGVPYTGPYSGGAELLARLAPKRADVPDIKTRSDKDLGWKGLVGLRMARHLAFEAGYMDLGTASAPSLAARSSAQVRTRTFTAFAVGFMPAGPIEVFAKAGPARIQSAGHTGGAYFDEQRRMIGYGAGVQLARRRLAVRAEYEKFGSGAAGKVDAISIGFRLSFRPG